MSVKTFVQNLIGFDSEVEEYNGNEFIEYEEVESEEQPQPQSQQTRTFVPDGLRDRQQPINSTEQMKNKVVGMPGLSHNNAEVMVIKPESFSEMPKVIDALRERKSVVLNLGMMSPQEAQRAVDFVAGGTYAMDGHNERVGDSIFLFAPSCVTVSNLSEIISGADDFAATRLRNSNHSVDNSADFWERHTVVAQ
jgi:cell division inhibitor SepF